MTDFPSPPNDPRRPADNPFGGMPGPAAPPPAGPGGPVPGMPPPGTMPPGSMPPGGPPPGGFAPPAEKKSRKGCLWTILAIVLLAVLGIGGCVFVVVRAVKGPVDASNDYFAAVVDNRPQDAIALLDPSPSCFGEGRGAAFDDLRQSRPRNYTLLTSSVESFNGETTGVVSGSMTSDAGQFRVVIDLNKRGDDWLICGYRFTQ